MDSLLYAKLKRETYAGSQGEANNKCRRGCGFVQFIRKGVHRCRREQDGSAGALYSISAKATFTREEASR